MSSFLPHTHAWVARHEERLERVGLVHVNMSDANAPRRSIHVAVEGIHGFAEVIVQDSGEAGLTYGTVAAPQEERLELGDLDDLDQFLGRFLERAEAIAT
jgi:hypothetical protein